MASRGCGSVPLALVAAGAALALAPDARRGAAAGRRAGLGLAGVLLAGFAIGAQRLEPSDRRTRPSASLPGSQFGIGLGGAPVLLALLMLFGVGIARLGCFRGDLFVACAVVLCSALLLLFVALPVRKALAGALLDEDGSISLAPHWLERLGQERVWGLGCLAGGVRCGVAWNTLFLALLTAAGTTVLGTLIALLAERGSKRLARPLHVLALLPIITPPFVVGLGLILLFGRAGLVNQVLEAAFGVTPTRWFYGVFGVWLAQMFAFTPIAFMIMRGVVQGISPSLEEAAQTLRASRARTFVTVTLPLMKPGLANAFLVGFIESMADFGNPIVVGGQYSVLSTDIFFAIVGAQFDQGRAASLALILTLFALGVFFVQQRVLGRKQLHHRVAARATPACRWRCPTACAAPATASRCRGWPSPWWSTCSPSSAASCRPGAATTRRRWRTSVTAFDLQWGELGLVWAGTAWNSLFTTLKLAGHLPRRSRRRSAC